MNRESTAAKTEAKHLRIAHGFNIIPLRKRDKQAAIPWKKFQDSKATDDEFEGFDWSGNIGIVTGKTSGIVVLDIDGEKGWATLE